MLIAATSPSSKTTMWLCFACSTGTPDKRPPSLLPSLFPRLACSVFFSFATSPAQKKPAQELKKRLKAYRKENKKKTRRPTDMMKILHMAYLKVLPSALQFLSTDLTPLMPSGR